MTDKEFQTAAEQLRPRLMAAAARWTGDHDCAEDVVQDVLLRLWQMRDSLRLPMDALAMTMTRNFCINALRDRKPTVGLEGVVLVERSPDEDEVEEVLHLVDRLSESQRQVVRMKHIDGKGNAEIASITGMTEVAVRKCLSRARMAMRTMAGQGWRSVASAVVLGIVLSGTAAFLYYRSHNYCVAYFYGRRVTDRQEIVRELGETMQQIGGEGQMAVEDQLQDVLLDGFQ